jgi:cytochrome P450
VDDPTILPTAIEEFLRLTSAVTGQARTVTRDCTFAQTSLARGDRVVLLWAAANRDESVFADPDELNMERSPNRHLAFGSGAHRCLGAHLARLQLRVMLEEFLRRMPVVHPAPGKPPVHHAGETWGLRSLPVVLAGPVAPCAGGE